MKKLFIILVPLLSAVICLAQMTETYTSLDTNNPIIFSGNYIVFQEIKIPLGPKSFFIDGQLSDEEIAKYPYVFNSVNEATKHLIDGTEESPMVLFIAPYVYWVDDPDDPAIRIPKSGNVPFAIDIKCEWLKFHGLSDDPRNVVLACNRGQTMGAKGNFTLFRVSGQGTSAENITFGNYCNIDLEYPLKPEFNRKKRGSAIVQAQLIFCDGDKLFARNTRFVSRLNLNPFFGAGKRALFDHCHFESTDDALNKTAVYINCTLDFYSSKPFGSTTGTGAVFLNCDIKSFSLDEQFFSKGGGPVATLDTRLETETATYWGWRDFPSTESRYYQYNILYNGEPFLLGLRHPQSTVDMTGKAVLDAYRFIYKGEVVYNTYNLLRGNDDWDPMGIKDLVLAAEQEYEKSYINLPTQLLITPTRDTIETGRETVVLNAIVNRFGNYELKGEKISWEIAPEYESLVNLKINKNGTCEVIPTNENNEIKEVIVTATTSSGLESASILYISPFILEPPKFSSHPNLIKNKTGKLTIDYKIDTKFEDQSLVSWYRCSDVKGNNPIEINVSRMNKPKREYELSAGDIGWYIMATVAQKHIRSKSGKAVAAILDKPVSTNDVKANNRMLVPDLKSMSVKHQPEVKPGFWTLDCYAPTDTHEYDWTADNSIDPWYYGSGVNGAANDAGFVQATKGARLRYTPIGKKFGDMEIQFTAVPAKTAGQGFSSATAQYMDVFIKFDTENMNGYALRIVRTTKYHDALDFVLMKYENGNAIPICETVSTSCYRPNCYISVQVKGNKLIVHAETPAEYYVVPNRDEVVPVVNIETEIIPNDFGGIGFQHTGTVKSGATLIKDLKIEWM